jgi:sugar/nucleoside kinase (ribokinase family)
VPKIRAFSELSNIFKEIFNMKQILGIGNALVDIMTLIDDDQILKVFSLPKGSMQLVNKEKSDLIKSRTAKCKRTLSSGGSAANTIHGLAMLDAVTGFIGSIGADETGDFFERDMKNAGVNTILFRRDSVTGTAVALISPNSERTFATHLGAAIELGPDDLNKEQFKPFDILYLEGYLLNDKSLVDKACKIAGEKKMEVALDLASYNVVEAKIDDFKEIIEKYVDILFANEEEARSFTGLDPEEAIYKIADQCKVTVIKVGEKGSIIKSRDGIIKIKSVPVKCKDTTGAGDLYASGFLYGFANNLSLDKCGHLGALLAGNVIETVGARINESKWPEIKECVLSVVNE